MIARRILQRAVFMFLMASAGSAFALNLGTNITINDGILPAGINVGKEDNECEPGMIQSQVWDLEGFFMNGRKLSIAGGYNFYTGVSDGSKIMHAGDIFIDTNGDAVYSPNIIPPPFSYNPGYKTVSNSLFKYDYVLDVDWANGTFNVIRLDGNAVLQDTEYGSQYNKPSNPWIYVSGGTKLNTSALSFNTYGKAQSSDADTGFSSWGSSTKHYLATFDLGAYVDLTNGALFHNTMECGNDNLLGKAAPVPEPSTCLLVGAGVAALVAVRRRQKH